MLACLSEDGEYRDRQAVHLENNWKTQFRNEIQHTDPLKQQRVRHPRRDCQDHNRKIPAAHSILAFLIAPLSFVSEKMKGTNMPAINRSVNGIALRLRLCSIEFNGFARSDRANNHELSCLFFSFLDCQLLQFVEDFLRQSVAVDHTVCIRGHPWEIFFVEMPAHSAMAS